MHTHALVRFASVAVAVLIFGHMPLAVAQGTATPSQAAPATQASAAAAADDEGELQLAEPDFRVINLPSTLRLPQWKSNFQLTHRFNGNLKRGSFSEQASNLFGLDQGAVVGFEYRIGIVRHVQAAVYRTAVDKTFQFYGKFDALHQNESMPLSVSGLVSIEGVDNFQERYSPALGVTASRMVGDRLAMYATPIWVHNTAAILNIDRDTFFIGVGGRLRIGGTTYVVAEITPRVAGYSAGAGGVCVRHRETRRRPSVPAEFRQQPGIDLRADRSRRIRRQPVYRLQPRQKVFLTHKEQHL